VHIVAQGVRCAVGLSAEAAAAAIRARISRVRSHPFLVDGACEKLRCACDPRLDAKVLGVERMVMMADQGLRQILERLIRDAPSIQNVDVLLALPEVRPGFEAREAARVMSALARVRSSSIAVGSVEQVGAGHAGALSALAEAARRLSDGRQQVYVVGGVDSYLDNATLDWLEDDLRVKRVGTRAGFTPGEAVAMLAIVNDGTRVHHRLSSLAKVTGVACTREARSAGSDTGLMGEALTETISRVTREFHPPEEVITDVYGDINGERERTQDWGFALMRTAACFRDGTAYVSAAGECGDVGAATGALACVLAVQAWRRGYANGPRALVWAGSWGGLRGAALLQPGRS
jgi:3-oxoacyl-[acyl-carrier-protein] synthase-1